MYIDNTILFTVVLTLLLREFGGRILFATWTGVQTFVNEPEGEHDDDLRHYRYAPRCGYRCCRHYRKAY